MNDLLVLLSDSGYLVLCWGLWFLWSLFLYSIIYTDLLSFFYMQLASLTKTICWRFCLFPEWVILFLCFKKVIVHRLVWSYIQFFSSIALINIVCFNVNIMLSFNYYWSVMQLEIWDGKNTSCPFMKQNCFNSLESIVFPYEMLDYFSISDKNCVGIFMRRALNLNCF